MRADPVTVPRVAELDDTLLGSPEARLAARRRALAMDAAVRRGPYEPGLYRHPQAPIPLRPAILDERQTGSLLRDTRRLLRLIEQVCSARSRDIYELIDQLGYQRPPSTMLSGRESTNRWAFEMARPDIVVSGGRPWFVECNINSAVAGIEQLSLVDDFYWRDQEFVEVARRFRLSGLDLLGPRRDVVIRAGRSRGSAHPTVAVIGHTRDGVFGSEEYFRDVLVDLFRHGAVALFATPDDLTAQPDGLYLDDHRIDVCLRMFTLADTHENPLDVRAMRQAVDDDTSLVLAPEAGGVYASKKVLAWLTDAADGLPGDDGAFIQERVPWTQIVADTVTRWLGQCRDLLPLLVNERERFILKPSNAYGGHGAVVGRDTTATDWRAAVDAALASGDYVAQRFLPPDPVRFPMYLPDADEVALVMTTGVMSPLVMGGELAGVLHRQVMRTDTSVINTTKAGVMNTVMVVPS